MNRKGEMLFAASGPLMMVILGIGWIVCAGWWPPPSPGATAEQTVAMYRDNLLGIRFGMMLQMFGGALCVTYGAVIMTHMLRMTGPSPALAYAQFGSAAANALLFILPVQIWGAVSFRPERDIAITQFGHDMGWIIFDMVSSTTIIQFACIGMATLWDRGARAVFPRWYGYYCLLAALLVISPSFITFFKNGPFAWNGIFGFYTGVVVYTLWDFLTFIVLRKAIADSLAMRVGGDEHPASA